MYTTALVVFGKLEANSMIAALPFSALLAVPTIRSLYISSPPLGFSIGKPCLRHFSSFVSRFDLFYQMQLRSSCRL